MSVEHGPTAGEYIVHHLTHLQNKPMKGVIDFSVYNLDSIFWSVLLGVLGTFLLWKAAKSATAGVPGRFQAANFTLDYWIGRDLPTLALPQGILLAPEFWTAVWNSLRIAGGAAVLAGALGLLTGYVVARSLWRWERGRVLDLLQGKAKTSTG